MGGILNANQSDEAGIYEQRERVVALKQKLQKLDSPEAKLLLGLADQLVRKSVWIVGGDGWAYDIGYGGLDHVLDTGGQMSKSTPRGAVAKFAAGGKLMGKKDLGLIAMTYGHIYVASVALGAKDEQTLRAFVEAESYPGPSLIIGYSHCIAHGIAVDMGVGARQQKLAVDTGQWLLYRIICSRKIVSRCSPRANPRKRRGSSPRPRWMPIAAGNSMSFCPGASPRPATASPRPRRPRPRWINNRKMVGADVRRLRLKMQLMSLVTSAPTK